MAACGTQETCYKMGLMIQNMISNSSIYSPYLFPLTGMTSSTAMLNVTTTILIFKVLSLTNDKVLSVAMEVDLEWLDPNIPGPIAYISKGLLMSSSMIWTMNMYLLNAATSSVYISPSDTVYVMPVSLSTRGALVKENIIEEFAVVCDTMELTDYPFDKQTCYISMQYNDLYKALTYFSCPPTINLNGEISNDEWTVTSVNCSNLNQNGTYRQNGISIIFELTRNSFYYILFLIIPTILLQSTAILTLILPSDRGEKVVLGATIVVATYVLISYLNQQIPQVQYGEVPHMVIALDVGFLMSSLAVIEAVIVQTLRIVLFNLPETIPRNINCGFFSTNASLKRLCKTLSFHLDATNSDEEPTSLETSKSDEFSRSDNGADFTAEVSINIEDEMNGEPEIRPAVTSNVSEKMLTLMMLEERDAKKRRKIKEGKLRRIEYGINFAMFTAYIVVLGYFFGWYIYQAQ